MTAATKCKPSKCRAEGGPSTCRTHGRAANLPVAAKRLYAQARQVRTVIGSLTEPSSIVAAERLLDNLQAQGDAIVQRHLRETKKIKKAA